MYPQPFSPMPIGGNYQTPMDMYARGGSVRHDAQMLQRQGVGRDRILAHINPEEAEYLSENHGMSINPHTGLPQFGFFDMVRSAAPQLGQAAMAALPGLWSSYARPRVENALGSIDQKVQQALPNLGGYIGGKIGPNAAQFGQALGNGLSNVYGQAGGLSGQLMPQADRQMGVPTAAPAPINPFNAARNVAQNVWNDYGKGAVRGGLQNVDQSIMNSLPKWGSRLGAMAGAPFGGAGSYMGSQIGSRAGSGLSNMYGNTPGISGYAMPKINQFVGNMTQPSYAQGGYVSMPQSGGYMHQYSYPNY